MYNLLGSFALLVSSVTAQANVCVVPAADSGEPYLTLATFQKDELRWLLNEYMFAHSWTKHSEAVSAGFRSGDRVYGEVLKVGGKFRAEGTAAWRRAYETSARAQLLRRVASNVNMVSVDRQVVQWILDDCLRSATWSRVKVIDDCRFEFAAGLESTDPYAWAARPRKLEMRGGRCSPWSPRPLSVHGDTVQCTRSGSGPVVIELKTDQAGVARQVLPPLSPADVPPEPLQARQLSEPESRALNLFRSRDYRLVRLGSGCRRVNCMQPISILRRPAQGAVILRITTVSSSGGAWKPCPAGLRCGVYEFSPPDQPALSGCVGLELCRVWRLAENNAKASDVIQITYQKPQLVCANCPVGMDFQTARKLWERARTKAAVRCAVMTDLPAQLINPAPRN